MPRGGPRPNSGRPKGSGKEQLTRAIAEKAKAQGELPHEFLLRVSRGEEINGYTPSFSERMHAAKEAAPYYAARLQSIEQKIEQKIEYVAQADPLTPEQWISQYGSGEEESKYEQ